MVGIGLEVDSGSKDKLWISVSAANNRKDEGAGNKRYMEIN